MKKNFYELLEIEKSASTEDIKKAYRKLALQHHPDRNQGDGKAEELFKQVSEAYATLSDPQKRAAYDRPQVKRTNPYSAQKNPFEEVQDIFNQQFRQQQKTNGVDVRLTTTISLKTSVIGGKSEITLDFDASCGACNATGAKDGVTTTCLHCNGTGRNTTRQGPFEMVTPCMFCFGSGGVPKDGACKACKGACVQTTQKNIKLNIPAGIDSGQVLRLQGQGGPGLKGGRNGDIFITIMVEKDPDFQRRDRDLLAYINVPFTTALLGGKVQLRTLDEGTAVVEVPAGVQNGYVLKMPGLGVPSLKNPNTVGDLYLSVTITVPSKISDEAREKVLELQHVLESENLG